MTTSPATLTATMPLRRGIRRLARYASVSAISTATSLTILALLVGLLGMPAVLANVIATSAGTVPSFELNRRWVWSQGGRRVSLAQVVPFCALSFGGLLASSLAVHLAGEASAHDGRFWHTVAVEAANAAAYGSLWVVQFVLCDRVLFAERRRSAGVGERPA
ncbi:MAG TPA: GtrA family protein [Acidimicrobiales bacterium]|nr:GtrA family protein [Acidimicrobiales bacterium]